VDLSVEVTMYDQEQVGQRKAFENSEVLCVLLLPWFHELGNGNQCVVARLQGVVNLVC
jgi:hypothetical protein